MFLTIIRYAEHQMIGKLNNLKVLGAIKPKGLNSIALNLPRLPLPEEGEP